VIAIGAGVWGPGLALHRVGIACRVYDSTAEILPLGVGINALPHATAELQSLGVLEARCRLSPTPCSDRPLLSCASMKAAIRQPPLLAESRRLPPSPGTSPRVHR
jgi:hypothetical protein